MHLVLLGQCWLSAGGHVPVVPAAGGGDEGRGSPSRESSHSHHHPHHLPISSRDRDWEKHSLQSRLLSGEAFFFFFNSPNETEVHSLKG